MKSVKVLSEELEVSKQTIYNNIKRLNIETRKKENTSYIKKDTDVEKVTQRVNENKKKYGFENITVNKQETESDNIKIESQNDTQMIEILKNQIETLNKQFEKQEKRHETTIEFYRKELQQRSKLLENQQILALESNKKIQKLEYQLEEERQLKYTFNTATNARQNINEQEAEFTEENQSMNQQQEMKQSTETEHKDISEENNYESIKENEIPKDEKSSEGIQSEPDDREEEAPKKGFWSRLFGN